MTLKTEGIGAQALKNNICILLELNWNKFKLEWNKFGPLNAIATVINIK